MLARIECQPIAEALIADAFQLITCTVDKSRISPAMVMSSSVLRDIQRLRFRYFPPRLAIILDTT